MSLKVIVLDFDGVIVESNDVKTEAFRKVFSSHPEHTEAAVAYHLEQEGVSRYLKFAHVYREIFREPYGESVEARLADEFSRLVLEGIAACPFVEGAVEFLECFSDVYSLYIVSGTPDEELRGIVDDKGLSGHFRDVLGSSVGKTERLRSIMEIEDVSPGETMLVGDAMTDYRAARKTGARFVARVAPGEESVFPEGGVEATVSDLCGLAEYVVSLSAEE